MIWYLLFISFAHPPTVGVYEYNFKSEKECLEGSKHFNNEDPMSGFAFCTDHPVEVGQTLHIRTGDRFHQGAVIVK